jgi:hypothetical protein
MLGSPNFFRGIYNGSGAVENIRKGSQTIQSLFETQFSADNVVYEIVSKFIYLKNFYFI